MSERNIPYSAETAVIGIGFDVPNQRETIVFGNSDAVKKYFVSGITSDEINFRTRKLGTIIDEMNKLATSNIHDKMEQIITASAGLCGVIGKGKSNKSAAEFTEILSNLYDNSTNANMLFNYIIFFILTNFNLNHKSLSGEFHISVNQMKKSAEKFAEQYNACISDILLPFRNLPEIPESKVRYWDIRQQHLLIMSKKNRK